MPQSAHPHRKLKITVVVALALVVTLLGFAGNFLFDFALNPQVPYTMKMIARYTLFHLPHFAK